MSNFKGLAHIGIHTFDIEASKKFYIENLGFEFVYEKLQDAAGNKWTMFSFVNLNGLVVEFIQHSDEELNKKGNSGSCDHIAIEVKNLDGIMSDLKEKGIIFEFEKPRVNLKMFNGIQVNFLRGPSGERLELFEHLG
ncbi:MAG: hypothetical protein K0R31_2038 [Clostridiales bacterium]|jgi:catechol 2,3-dioxygenase-like lactoylglutathione lyase family enzyme|nr:hypothetical protein [Clostridiales bacterium]